MRGTTRGKCAMTKGKSRDKVNNFSAVREARTVKRNRLTGC